ncbi:MAG: hypothetical protein QOF53_2638 [Nocardioidaceae bacterium]|jgi:hypothetical protein|nr:hypothetical protein [Nocardioidaceae bacterium]
MKQQLRRLVVVPILAMVAGLLLVTAGPATAAGSCSVVAPRRLSISSPVQTFHARLAGDCARAHMDFASWNVTHPSIGVSDILIFDAGQASDSWQFYDWEHLGTYRVTPRSAWDVSSRALSENTGRMSIRLVSHVAIRASRTGRFVTLRSSATRYRPSVSAFRPWVGRAIALSYRTCRTCSWHHITTRTTDGNGRIAPRRVLAPTAREFRAEIAKMSTTWGTTSAPVRR